jgi:hypothetical protein
MPEKLSQIHKTDLLSKCMVKNNILLMALFVIEL